MRPHGSVALTTTSGSAPSLLINIYKSIINFLISSFISEGSRAITNMDRVNKAVEEACRCLKLSDDQLKKVMQALKTGMEQGLKKGTPPGVGLKMIPSYVRATPNGTETGDFLALDLGGTNFRVLLIRLKGSEAEMKGKIYEIPVSIQRGTGEKLFDHIAECIALFTTEQFGSNKRKLPLGFTFSFPLKQDGLTRAKLIQWTKGFNASGCVGEDVVQLLRKACKKRADIDIDVVAVLNDTVGTLMACAFKENTCHIGVIVGTGTNACYLEKLEKVQKMKGEWENDGLPDEIIINMEWGGFGDDGAISFIYNEYDSVVDKLSINPGKQIFEKMISGMYMGELVRIVVEGLAKKGVMFNGSTAGISKQGCFTTAHVSTVEAEAATDGRANSYPKTREILRGIGINSISDDDCMHVAYICAAVSSRAAYLCAAAIAQVLNHIKRPFVTVGVDGSVYRFHPTFQHLLDQKISALVDNQIKYQLMLSKDGSGVGAAVVAAVATRIHKSQSGTDEED
ncbi:Hexokinase [Dictyocaulus viviparus]|uniref:Phosphotransferase n=1 Tax=Dictyocaulus viviparus TaxID=29172 RepID=A0A0D8XXE8_DICVI|nr:Hexokinase [Dictyocaulus viviparus]